MSRAAREAVVQLEKRGIAKSATDHGVFMGGPPMRPEAEVIIDAAFADERAKVKALVEALAGDYDLPHGFGCDALHHYPERACTCGHTKAKAALRAVKEVLG